MERKITRMVKVGTQGQIAIPADLRRELGIKSGEKVLVSRIDRYIIIQKPRGLIDRFVEVLKRGLGKSTWKEIERERELESKKREKERKEWLK